METVIALGIPFVKVTVKLAFPGVRPARAGVVPAVGLPATTIF